MRQSLNEVASFVRGVTYKPSDLLEEGAEGSIACLRTKNIQNELVQTDLLFIPRRLVRRDEQIVRANDTIISSANSWHLIGKAVLADRLSRPFAIGGFIGLLRPKAGSLDARYLHYWFTSLEVQRKVRSFSRQTTNIANLDVARMMQMPVDFPAISDQRRLAELFDEVRSLRHQQREGLRLLDELNASLQHRAFTGHL